MPRTPSYEEHPVPADLQGTIRRIMRIALTAAESITIRARPTGYPYIGWFSKGCASATANGNEFVISANQVHMSGQLSTFDASFTLQGPCVQFLAECAADGLYRITGEDMGALCDGVKILEAPRVAGPTELDTFLEILLALQTGAKSSAPSIAAAATAIEAANGNLTIADLAATFDISDRHFRRNFTKIIGLSPKAYASVRRVLYAVRLFSEDPTQSVADVSIAAGFYDQAHLIRAFNQYLGATPAKLAFDDDGVLRSIVAGAG